MATENSSNQISISLSDATLAAIRRSAVEAGISVSEAAARLLENSCGVTESSIPAAGSIEDDPVRKFFGSVSLHLPAGSDNEQIDADIVRGYTAEGE